MLWICKYPLQTGNITSHNANKEYSLVLAHRVIYPFYLTLFNYKHSRKTITCAEESVEHRENCKNEIINKNMKFCSTQSFQHNFRNLLSGSHAAEQDRGKSLNSTTIRWRKMGVNGHSQSSEHLKKSTIKQPQSEHSEEPLARKNNPSALKRWTERNQAVSVLIQGRKLKWSCARWEESCKVMCPFFHNLVVKISSEGCFFFLSTPCHFI